MKQWVTKNHQDVIIKVSKNFFNSYLVKSMEYNFLVDTSLRIFQKSLTTTLEKMDISKIDAILLTHVHFDHVANAAALQKKYQCPIFINENELDELEKGFCKLPEGANRFTRRLVKIAKKIDGPFRNFALCDKDVFPFSQFNQIIAAPHNIEIIHTPGHSCGSTCIQVDNEIILIGDNAMHFFGKGIYPVFADDEAELLVSWERLIDTDNVLFLPGHGNEISRAKFQANYEQRVRLKDGR